MAISIMLTENTQSKEVLFWKKRSKKYNRLEWATRSGYLQAFLKAGDFQPDDAVLDVGTGTGIVAEAVAPSVSKVTGVDICNDMLKQARGRNIRDADFLEMDVRQMIFPDETFTKVTARMVFHHILEDAQKAVRECYRVLKPGGRIVLSEGVPPTEHVKGFYTEMFKLKENRITFMEDELIQLISNAGFHIVEKKIYIAEQCSIRNWLENSNNLSREIQERIFKMHLALDEQGKKDYRMTLLARDCLLDMKFVIVTGVRI